MSNGGGGVIRPDAIGTRSPDAILCPPGFVPGEGVNRLQEYSRIFGPTLNTRRVTVYSAGGFGLGLPTPSIVGRELLFPKTHRLAGQERYAWYVGIKQADGRYIIGDPVGSFVDEPGSVKLGFIIDENHPSFSASDGRFQARQAALAALHAEPKKQMEKLNNLFARGAITQDEYVRSVQLIQPDPDQVAKLMRGDVGPAPDQAGPSAPGRPPEPPSGGAGVQWGGQQGT